MNIVFIVFAGKGTRINSDIPKQFIKIKDREIVSYTIETFNNHKMIDEIVLVTHPDYVDYVKGMVDRFSFNKAKHIVAGGETRQESVRLGLENVSYSEDDFVLIHDGDRPLVSPELISKCIEELKANDAVCPVTLHQDCIKQLSNAGRYIVKRGRRLDIQTPQCFRYGLIKKYHEFKKDVEVKDDISLIENEYKVKFITGEKNNFKITTDVDLDYFKSII